MSALAKNGHWLVRIVMAGIFIPHGISKFGAVGTPMVDMLFLGSNLVAVLVGLAELTGGILFLVGGLKFAGSGLLTRLAAAEVIVVMVGAVITVHWGRWHFAPAEGFPMGGMQLQVLVIAVALWFLIAGNASGGAEEPAAA